MLKLEEAEERFVLGKASRDDLKLLFENESKCAIEAAQKLLETNPSLEELRMVIKVACNWFLNEWPYDEEEDEEYKERHVFGRREETLSKIEDEAIAKLLEESRITNEDLRYIVTECPCRFRKIALEKLRIQGPTKEDWQWILKNLRYGFPGAFLEKEAALKILKENPTKEDLKDIIEYAPIYDDELWEKIIEAGLTNGELIGIFGHYLGSLFRGFRARVIEELIKRELGNEELRFILNLRGDVAPLIVKGRAALKLFKQASVTKEDIYSILQDVAPFNKKVLQKILKRGLGREDLEWMGNFWNTWDIDGVDYRVLKTVIKRGVNRENLEWLIESDNPLFNASWFRKEVRKTLKRKRFLDKI